MWVATREEARAYEEPGCLIHNGLGPHTRSHGVWAMPVTDARKLYAPIPDYPADGYVLIHGENKPTTVGICDVFRLLDGRQVFLLRDYAWYILRDQYGLSGRAVDWLRHEAIVSDAELADLPGCAERIRAWQARLARYVRTERQWGPSPNESHVWLGDERAEVVYAREWDRLCRAARDL